MGRGIRRAVNLLICGVAVAGTGWGGYESWSVLSARHAIASECADLVSAGQVMGLPYGGGRISVSPEGIDDFRGTCRVYSTESGDSFGLNKGDGKRSFFLASVGLEPAAAEESPDDTYVLDLRGSPYLDSPLGGGIPGIVTDSGVGVKLPCGNGTRHEGKPVRNVVASAVSTNDGHSPFTTGRQMPQETRDRLASLAVDTANRLADRLGCTGRLPTPPSDIPPVQGELRDPGSAKGTCAWYGKGGYARSGGLLPDRVVETRTDPDVWTEKCGLAMSSEAAWKTWHADEKKPGDAALGDPPNDEAAWWASTQSWFGESARHVELPGIGFDTTSARPGEAGRAKGSLMWWASSVCDGKPAVHTLSLGNRSYGKHAARHFEPVFRAYVEDVTRRRGCTDVRLPGAAAFTKTGG